MTTERRNPGLDWEQGIRDLADDIAECVGLVGDLVIGNGASLVANVLRRVDQLVDDVVADAADVAQSAEDLFASAFGGCDTTGEGDPADSAGQ